MKLYIYLISLSLLTLCSCSHSQKTTRSSSAQSESGLLSYQKVITPAYLKSHLSILAADSMRGRETGMPGQKKAAAYLASQYHRLGMKPVGDQNTYFQTFDITANQTDSVIFTVSTFSKSNHDSVTQRFLNGATASSDFIRRFGGTQKSQGDVVFAGFGIQDSSLGINQFKGLDVKGKWVMVFSPSGKHFPQVIHGDTLYTNRRSFFRSWFQNIAQKGVAGILVIPDMSAREFKSAAGANRQQFGQPSGMQLAYRAKEQRTTSFSYDLMNPAAAAEWLDISNGTAGLDSLKKNMAENMNPFKPHETNYYFSQTPHSHSVALESENVAAFLKGGDPKLNDQVVVLSAHYDHLGVGAADSTGDRIYNGANDDGSGTIGVLSAARAFAKARDKGIRPRRSILFLSVAGEEKGLLGSRYYSDHPIYPVKKTAADINTDMIGRMDPMHVKSGEENYIYVIGAGIISSDIDSLMKAGNARAGKLDLSMRYNDLTDPNQFYRRSDHWNFGRLGIPFVFFFNGVHEDYHQQSDEVDKIRFPLMAKTARTMFGTTVMVANADSMPAVDNQAFIEATQQ